MKYLLLLLCLVLCFCTETAPAGCSDFPKLSKKELLFSTQGGVDSVIVDDSFMQLDRDSGKECKYIGAENEPNYCSSNYCISNGSVSSNLTMKIECPWFAVQQISKYIILVSVDKNETGEERNGGVGIQAGNCFGAGFKITQSGE